MTLFGFVILLQWLGGSDRSEAGHFPDESGHFMSGLLIRDYLLSGFQLPPLDFARQYYVHYPKLGFGIFPPLFHILLGIWLLPFGSYAGGLLFSGAIIGAMSYLVYRMTRAEYGAVAAILAGALFASFPLSRTLALTTMVDQLVALFGLLTAMATARFLRTDSTRNAILLGLCCAAACGTKGNGVGVVLCPAIAIVVTGRFDLLRKKGIYVAAAVTLLAAPFLWLSQYLYQKNLSFQEPGASFVATSATLYGRGLLTVSNGVVLVLFVGLGWKLVDWWKSQQPDPIWPSVFSLVVGTLAFHIGWPQPPEARYLITALAGLAVFSPAAFGRFASWRVPALSLLLGVNLWIGYFDTPVGMREVVREIESHPGSVMDRVLVVSDPLGEGSMVVELAEADRKRPGRYFAIRGSKLLARSDWNGHNYQLRVEETGELVRLLEDTAVNFILVDTTADAFGEHGRLVNQMVHDHPDRIVLEKEWPVEPGRRTRHLVLYRVPGASPEPLKPLTYFLDSTLGTELGF